MIFKPKRKPDIDLNIQINSTALAKTRSNKNLGVILDDELNWREHQKLIY